MIHNPPSPKHSQKCWCHNLSNHGCQNPDQNPIILRFYDPSCPKRFGSFKNLSDHSRSVGSYDSDNSKWPWFLVIFFNLIEGSVRPKWKIKS